MRNLNVSPSRAPLVSVAHRKQGHQTLRCRGGLFAQTHFQLLTSASAAPHEPQTQRRLPPATGGPGRRRQQSASPLNLQVGNFYFLSAQSHKRLSFGSPATPAPLTRRLAPLADGGKFSAELYSPIPARRTAVRARGPSQGPFVSER